MIQSVVMPKFALMVNAIKQNDCKYSYGPVAVEQIDKRKIYMCCLEGPLNAK